MLILSKKQVKIKFRIVEAVDPETPGLKFMMVFSAIMGYTLAIIGIVQVICLLLKFNGYRFIVDMMGNKYYVQLPLGLLFIASYYWCKRGIRLYSMKSGNDRK
jgi:hypothetical protein